MFCVVFSLSLLYLETNKQTNKRTHREPRESNTLRDLLSLSLFSLSVASTSALLDEKKKTPTEAFNREREKEMFRV